VLSLFFNSARREFIIKETNFYRVTKRTVAFLRFSFFFFFLSRSLPLFIHKTSVVSLQKMSMYFGAFPSEGTKSIRRFP
jgi:hypothetical protein